MEKEHSKFRIMTLVHKDNSFMILWTLKNHTYHVDTEKRLTPAHQRREHPLAQNGSFAPQNSLRPAVYSLRHN
jgi:hypothetical protein